MQFSTPILGGSEVSACGCSSCLRTELHEDSCSDGIDMEGREYPVKNSPSFAAGVLRNRSYHDAVKVLRAARRAVIFDFESGPGWLEAYGKLGRAIELLSKNGRIG